MPRWHMCFGKKLVLVLKFSNRFDFFLFPLFQLTSNVIREKKLSCICSPGHP